MSWAFARHYANPPPPPSAYEVEFEKTLRVRPNPADKLLFEIQGFRDIIREGYEYHTQEYYDFEYSLSDEERGGVRMPPPCADPAQAQKEQHVLSLMREAGYDVTYDNMMMLLVYKDLEPPYRRLEARINERTGAKTVEMVDTCGPKCLHRCCTGGYDSDCEWFWG